MKAMCLWYIIYTDDGSFFFFVTVLVRFMSIMFLKLQSFYEWDTYTISNAGGK